MADLLQEYGVLFVQQLVHKGGFIRQLGQVYGPGKGAFAVSAQRGNLRQQRLAGCGLRLEGLGKKRGQGELFRCV